MLLSFWKQKYTKRTSNDAVQPIGIYKPKDGRNLKEWEGVKIFDIRVQDKEFKKTAKQREA
jgi:hypothetical protein